MERADGAPEARPLTMEDKKDLLQDVLKRRGEGAAADGASPPEPGDCGCCPEGSPRVGVAAPIPEPDYSDSEEENRLERANCRLATGPDGLILPRKLTNPCLADPDRRQLHRELIFNQKIGKNVLGQKSELQKAMERHREQQQRRESQLKMQNNKSSFEMALEERLMRVEPKMVEDPPSKLDVTPEFLKVHAKVRANINTPS